MPLTFCKEKVKMQSNESSDACNMNSASSSSVLGALAAPSPSCAKRAAPAPKKSAPKKIRVDSRDCKPVVKDEDDIDIEDTDDEEETDDGDENDSIVVDSDDDTTETVPPLPTDDDEDGAKALAAILNDEAKRFVGETLDSRVKNGRALRNNPKPREFPERDLIRDAFIEDEKRELINEVKIWGRTLADEAKIRGLTFPELKMTMTIDEVRSKHDALRISLGLDASDDEESEEVDDESSDDDDEEDEEDEEDEDDEDDTETETEDEEDESDEC